MRLSVHITEALNQLLSSKLRAFLAVLGILVGTASVVAMVSIGQLAGNQILQQFKEMGINLLSVTISQESSSYGQPVNPHSNLSLKNAEKLVQQSNEVQIVAPYVSSYGSIIYNGRKIQGSTVGITPSMNEIAKLKLSKGRLLSFVDAGDYYCVIGDKIANNMLKNGAKNPIGENLKVGSNIYTVVGIIQKWPTNFFFNTDFNSAIMIPIQTALSTQKNATITALAIRIRNSNELKSTSADIKKYIAAHTLKKQVYIRSPKSLIDSAKQSSETLTILLGLIGSIALIVGGIGIMNIMLVSVAERHREIGIRKAIGAKNKDIILQFLIEAIVLSIFGGVVGMLLGILTAYIVAFFKGWPFAIFLLPPFIGCIVTICVGIFFGFYPAYKASKLDAIETLRSD